MPRLKDVYYTDKNLDGIPEPPGKATPIEFYQGEDVVFDVFLNYNGKPVKVDEWKIEAFVKKNKYAQTVLWKGVLDNGLYKHDVEGYYKVIIPSEATSYFLAGTYWMTVLIRELNGDGPKDLDVVILNQPFSIGDSASSPHPGNSLDRGSTEKTYPPATSADKI